MIGSLSNLRVFWWECLPAPTWISRVSYSERRSFFQLETFGKDIDEIELFSCATYNCCWLLTVIDDACFYMLGQLRVSKCAVIAC